MLGEKEVALRWDVDANKAEQCHNAMSEIKTLCPMIGSVRARRQLTDCSSAENEKTALS